MTNWGFAKTTKYFWDRYHGIAKNSLKTYFLKGMSVSLVLCLLEILPMFAQFIPVKLLAKSHPKTNIAVVGFGFPAFIFFLRKSALGYFMRRLQKQGEDGEIKQEDILPLYTTMSKIISCFLLCSSIVVMYYSGSEEMCAIAGTTSIVTEVGGKLWSAWGAKVSMNDIVKVAAEEAKTTAMQKANHATAEPGVTAMLRVSGRGAKLEVWKQKVATAEESAKVANGMVETRDKKIAALKELLRKRAEKRQELVKKFKKRVGEVEQKVRERFGDLVTDELFDELDEFEDEELEEDESAKSAVEVIISVEIGASDASSSNSEEETKDDDNLTFEERVNKLVIGRNWDLILGMLAARWNSEIVGEKTLIIVAAFLVWLFDLVDDLPQMKLLRIMGIFFGTEFIADMALVYALERWFGLPFSRLPKHKSKKDFFTEVLLLAVMMVGLAMGIMTVDGFINAHL